MSIATAGGRDEPSPRYVNRRRSGRPEEAPGTPRRADPPRLQLLKRDGRQPVYMIYHGEYQESTGTTNLVEAQRRFLRYQANLTENPAAVMAGADWTFSEIIADYWRRSVDRPGTLRYQRLHDMDMILQKFWGQMTLTDVTPTSCDAYKEASTVSRGTVRSHLKRLKTLTNEHRKRKNIAFSPLWELPPKPEARSVWLTRTEVARMICAARGRTWDRDIGGWKRTTSGRLALRPSVHRASTRSMIRLILIGAFTGTRADAMLRARWSENPAHPHLDADGELFYRKGSSEVVTRKQRPVAIIVPELARLVRLWRKADAARGCDRVITRFAVRDGAVVPTDKTFDPPPGAAKETTGVSAAGEVFRALRCYAGLTDVTIHTLRHTCATWLLESADIEDVAQFLGLTVRELEETYGQYHYSFTAVAARALNEWGRAKRPPPTGKGWWPAPIRPMA